ncbi:hypothetical protein STEG23_010618, partial [Scotinomys teguina]
ESIPDTMSAHGCRLLRPRDGFVHLTAFELRRRYHGHFDWFEIFEKQVVNMDHDYKSLCSVFRFTAVGLSIAYVFMDVSDFLRLKFSSSAFCRTGFVDRFGLFMVSQISWTFCAMTFFGFGVFFDC